MFTESLLESSGGVRTNQRWTSLLSLSVQAVVLGLLILLPLLENQALPSLHWVVTTPLAPPPRGVLPSGAGGGGGTEHHPDISAPTPQNVIFLRTDLRGDAQGPETHSRGANGPEGVPWGVHNSAGPVLPTLPVPSLPPATVPPRHSMLTEGNVIYRVLPVYPTVARQIGAQGPVVLHLVISKEGAVENLRVVSSAHPLLNAAALDAVRLWRFRPYLLNGVAVEAEAQITVNFTLSR